MTETFLASFFVFKVQSADCKIVDSKLGEEKRVKINRDFYNTF